MAFVTIKDKDAATLGYLQADANERLGVHNLLHVEDRKPAGTFGGTFTQGAWRTRDLNTVVVNNIAGASLVSNQITLPAGTYLIHGGAVAYGVNSHFARLYDVAGLVAVITGTSMMASAASNGESESVLQGTFTLSAQKTLELQHYCSGTKDLYGFGGSSTGANAYGIYARVLIWEIS